VEQTWRVAATLYTGQCPELTCDVHRLKAAAGFCSDKDGRFTLEKVCAMLELGFQRMRLYQPHEFGAQLAGWATLRLHRAMASAAGRESVVDWCAGDTCYLP